MPASRTRWAGLLLVLQPLYLLAELVAAAAVTVPYSLVSNTISDLGAVTCTEIGYPYGPVPVCSPLHALVNGAFIVFGLLLAVAAILWRGNPGRRGWGTAAVVCWVIAGLSSIGTGLTPLDQQLELHVLASTPVFLAQPVALVLTGIALRGHDRRLAISGIVLGVLTLIAAVAFFLTAGVTGAGGLLERLVLWPAYLWLAALGWALRRPAPLAR